MRRGYHNENMLICLVIYKNKNYVVLFRKKIKLFKLYIFQRNASFFTKNWNKYICIIKYIL